MRLLTLILILLISEAGFSQKAELIIPRGHTTPVTLLDFHEKEMWLASSQGDNGLTIWNYNSEKELRQLRNHDDALTALSFHPKFPFILSADATGRLIVSDIVKNRKRSDIEIHKDRINQILMSESGHYFYTCSNDSTVVKSGYVNLETIETYKCGDRIIALEQDKETEGLFAGTRNGELLWLFDGEIQHRQSVTKGSPIKKLHQIGNDLIIVSENGEIQKLNIKSREITGKVNSQMKIKDSELLGKHAVIAVGRGDKEIQKLDIKSMVLTDLGASYKLQKALDPYNIALQQVHVSRDSGYVFIPDYDYSIPVFSSADESVMRRFKGLTERVREIDIHPNGRTMGIASSVNGARLYDLGEIFPTHIIQFDEPAYSIDFSPLGTKTAVSYESKLRIYNNSAKELIHEFELNGQYPNGNTEFISEDHFLKKDEKEGVTLFNISNGSTSLLKIKEAFEVRATDEAKLFAVKNGSSKILLYNADTQKKVNKLKVEEIIDFDLNSEGHIIVLHDRKNRRISTLNTKGDELSTFILPENFNSNKLRCIPESDFAVTWNTITKKGGLKSDYKIEVWDLQGKDGISVLSGASSVITSVDWSEQGNLLVASSEDGSMRAWPLEKRFSSFEYPLTIFPLEGKELACITHNGVYDATREALGNMHYVQGKDYITLDQLKAEYYEPHLLSKAFGFNSEEVRSRNAVGSFNLYPEIKLQHPNTNGGILGVDLEERGGGVGDVYVWINGKKAKKYEPDEIDEEHIKFEVSGHPYLKPNEINTISVRAKNAEGDLISREKMLRYIWNQDAKEEGSKMYALIAGVSDYQGNRLDLQFASKDASDISNALKRGASKHFGVDNVEVITLNSDAADKNLRPSKKNIQEQMRLLAPRIKPGDIFLFYFAGHGMQGKEDDSHYYLITEEASKNDTRLMQNPEHFSISDTELATMLSQVSSNNMIMILDACHSGEMINRFNRNLGHLGSEEVRALEKLMDETGIYILAGSESDDVSYETSLYGQGLLTYSLLFGMKGEALRDGEYLDVTRLFQFAAGKVPELASTVGGVQRPEVKLPSSAGQIDIGRYGNNEKESISLISPRPIVLLPSFQEEKLFLDIKNMGQLMDQSMREIANDSDEPFIFLNSDNFSGAYEIKGRYLEDKNGYSVKARIFQGTTLVREISLSNEDFSEMVNQAAQECLNTIESDFNSN